MKKRCIYCNSRNTKKNGVRNRLQYYICNDCGRVFHNKRKNKNDIGKTYTKLYLEEGLSLRVIGMMHNISPRIVQKYINEYFDTWLIPLQAEDQFYYQENILGREDFINTILVVDTTFFGKRKSGKQYGVLTLRDYASHRVLAWKFVTSERAIDYLEGCMGIEDYGVNIEVVVCDGKRGLENLGYPIQRCIVHQKRTMINYLTKHPKLEAASSLLSLVLDCLGNYSKIEMKQCLELRESIYHSDLETLNPLTGKRAHPKLVSAYRSICRNLDDLYSFEFFSYDIPHTTNDIESLFAELKDLTRSHRGMRIDRQKILINIFMESH